MPKGKWSGQAAADFYAGPLKKALVKAYPNKRKHLVLEDNDPTGYRSNKGIKAKDENRIAVFEIPPRSPDLSLLDYSIWKEVNRRLREQEKKWPAGKRETKKQYVARLKRTASRLPQSFLEASIGDMVRRCKRLYDAKGWHFEEGGK